jgi:hypothetical protein
MGFYYDYVDRKYQEIDHHRELTPQQKRSISRRRSLLDELFAEIEHGGDSNAGLYARMLARALVKTDEILMRDLGEQVGVLTDPDIANFVKKAAA